jgi:Tol biopolymer transport system component
LILFGSAAPEAHAAFPGKNGRIAFSTDFSRRPQIFTVLPDGTGLRQLTHVPKGHVAGAADWSPDGTQLLFMIDNNIWVMDADGSEQRQLTHDPQRMNQAPSWSPDGRTIVFSRCISPFGEQRCSIDVMNADGSGVTKLLGGNWVHQNPEYSPDGKTITFASNRGGYVSNIWVIYRDGSGLKRITKPKLQAWGPDWSPDGSHILFTSDADLPFNNVWVMRPDGSELRELTHFTGGHSGGFAKYSPDGSKVVLVSDLAYPDYCCTDLYVMHADGSHLHAVVTNVPGIAFSDWGPAR